MLSNLSRERVASCYNNCFIHPHTCVRVYIGLFLVYCIAITLKINQINQDFSPGTQSNVNRKTATVLHEFRFAFSLQLMYKIDTVS